MRAIGIPLVEGYWRSVAAILSPLLMSSPVTSKHMFLWYTAKSSVVPNAPFVLKWNTCHASALTGQLNSLPLASWCTQTPFHPFFWLSSFSIALSAVLIRDAGAFHGRHTRVPRLFFWRKLHPPIWTGLFVLICSVFLLLCIPLYARDSKT